MYVKKGLNKHKKVPLPKADKKEPLTKTVPIKGDKNGGERVVPVHKAPRFLSS